MPGSQKWGPSVGYRALPQFSETLYTNGHHRTQGKSTPFKAGQVSSSGSGRLGGAGSERERGPLEITGDTEEKGQDFSPLGWNSPGCVQSLQGNTGWRGGGGGPEGKAEPPACAQPVS